uniref:DNA-directed RNA polymerase subunit beta n=1 Tax=Cryptoglena skujai TaxID=161229 RepID=A0A0G3SFE7_9EUGL|nr:RNA polymerase beta subunit [Cryptoglena skujai]AKL39006.1 RNA polymerase beta subunit [Cryptoglena skujai]
MNNEKKILSDLIKTQRKSYQEFIQKGFKEEIKKLSRIKYYNFELKIDFNNIKYKKPKNSLQECILKNKTYSIPIFIPVSVKYKRTLVLKNKYILVGEIPFMSEKGTFVINGNTRVIINQIIRSPGIYLEKNKKENTTIGTIIPNQGSWLIIKINKYKELFARIDKRKKIPILILLQAIGFSKKKILYNIKHINKIENKKKTFEVNSVKKALLKLNEYISEQETNIINVRKFLFTKFLDKTKYDLGEIGRNKLNKRIYKYRFWRNKRILQPEDILGITKKLTKFQNNEENSDDIDDLKNKRIRQTGELMQNLIKLNIVEVIKTIKEKLDLFEEKLINKNAKIDISKIINPYILTNCFKKFFATNQLSQLMEEINPISELTHKRKINSFGIGAIDRKKANLNIRKIHPSQYGRICPIETAEGKNAGLILSLSKDSNINAKGFIETPFYKVIKRKIMFKNGLYYISAEQETNEILAPGDVAIIKKKYILNSKNDKILLRKNQTFIEKKTKKINYITSSPNQIISIGTGLIPFLEHNDANRALMGSNMQRQAVPLLFKEIPILKTGIEERIAKDSESTISANKSGLVKDITNKKILLEISYEKENTKYTTKTLTKKIKTKQKMNKLTKNYEIIKHVIEKEKKTNQNTFFKQKFFVKKNEWIKKGQSFIDGSGTLLGELALGKNILIAYMPYKGYNFEDAIVINKRLVDENILTSIHIKKYKTFIINNETEEEKITKFIPNATIKVIKNLNKNGLIKLGCYINNENIIIGKIKKTKLTSIKFKLLTAIFGKNVLEDNSIKINKGIKGIITKIKVIKKKSIYSIIVYVTEERKVKLGDKVAGRHGNKGIISKILPKEDMPYLQDGRTIDMLLNPLGIPSRMNVGQIFESLLGLAGSNLKERYKITPFSTNHNENISKEIVYNKLFEARIKTGKKWLFNANHPGKMILLDGETGNNYTQPISIGYAYMLKLIHLVEDKINARLTGPYSLILKQPIRGKARNGGQRFGEMEVWALEGFGAAFILQELLTIKSDDLTNRSKLLYSLIKSKQIPEPSIPESLKTLILEMQCLCLNINIYSKNKKIKNFFMN